MSFFDFNAVAGEYDQYYESEYGKRVDFYEKRAVARLLEPGEGWKALEIGCGTGHWTSFFLEFGFEVTAIDISKEMIKTAKEKDLAGAHFQHADARNLPFEDDSFDHVFTITTLEFIEDRKQVMKEVRRVLKPGGAFLAGCLNLHSAIGESKDENPVFKDALFFTEKELFQLLSEFGDPKILGSALPDENGNMADPFTDEATLRQRGSFLAGIATNKKG